MFKAEREFQKLVDALADGEVIVAGQMFGKPCLKVGGKAFMARQGDAVIFKLAATQREKALSVDGATLWDPSGNGRPMKEWVAVPADRSEDFGALAQAALRYVSEAVG